MSGLFAKTTEITKAGGFIGESWKIYGRTKRKLHYKSGSRMDPEGPRVVRLNWKMFLKHSENTRYNLYVQQIMCASATVRDVTRERLYYYCTCLALAIFRYTSVDAPMSYRALRFKALAFA